MSPKTLPKNEKQPKNKEIIENIVAIMKHCESMKIDKIMKMLGLDDEILFLKIFTGWQVNKDILNRLLEYQPE